VDFCLGILGKAIGKWGNATIQMALMPEFWQII
jgi:hypothetical protein